MSSGTFSASASLDGFISPAGDFANGSAVYLAMARLNDTGGGTPQSRVIFRLALTDIDASGEEGETLKVTVTGWRFYKREATSSLEGAGRIAAFIANGGIESTWWDNESAGRDGLTDPAPVAVTWPGSAGWTPGQPKDVIDDLGGDAEAAADLVKWAVLQRSRNLDCVAMYDDDDESAGFNQSINFVSREETFFDPDNVKIQIEGTWEWSLDGTPPTVAKSIGTTPHVLGAGQVVVDPGVTIDANELDATIDLIEVEITTGHDSGDDALALPPGLPGVSSANFAAGVLTIEGAMVSGDATAAARAVTFDTDGNIGPRGITFRVTSSNTLTDESTERDLLVQPAASAPQTPDTNPVVSVIGAANIAGFFRAAATRRADVLLIGDSNLNQGGLTGHSTGFLRAWGTAMGCWGCAAAPAWGAGNWGGRCGETGAGTAVGVAADPPPGWSGAPEAFRAALFKQSPDGQAPDFADWITDWPVETAGIELHIHGRHPLAIQHGLVYSARVYIPEENAATGLYPSLMVNMAGGPSSVAWPDNPERIALPATPGFHTWTWTVPRAVAQAEGVVPYGDGFRIGLNHWGNTLPILGSFGVLYQSAENPAMHRGVRVSNFLYAGGHSSLYIAGLLCGDPDRVTLGDDPDPAPGYTDEALAEYFRFLASRQVNSSGAPLPPVVLIHVIEGGNDAGVGATNPGPGSIVWTPEDGPGGGTRDTDVHTNTKAGYKNNTRAIIARIKDVWTRVCGYSAADLYFVLGAYHPQPVEPQASFVGGVMVEAMTELAAEIPNVAGVDGYALRTTAQFAAKYYQEVFIDTPGTGSASVGDATLDYNTFRGFPLAQDYFHLTHSGTGHDVTDTAHLHEEGYNRWGMAVVGALMESQLGRGGGLTSVIGGRRSLRAAQEEELD